MAWEKSKAFLEKIQLISIILYLICLGGYAVPPIARAFDRFQDAAHFKVVEISGFAFFSLFIASTILLRLEDGDDSEGNESADSASSGDSAQTDS